MSVIFGGLEVEGIHLLVRSIARPNLLDTDRITPGPGHERGMLGPCQHIDVCDSDPFAAIDREPVARLDIPIARASAQLEALHSGLDGSVVRIANEK